MLLLDEPTNDLDLQTLRVLEEALLSFDGAMVVVTHDRAFMDRVCSRILNFEEDGIVEYADRLQALAAEQRRQRQKEEASRIQKSVTKSQKDSRVRAKSVRLSFKEKRELASLPQMIEELEVQKTELEEILAAPETYRDLSLIHI